MSSSPSGTFTFRPNRNEADVADWIDHHREAGDLREVFVAAIRLYMQQNEPTLDRSPVSLANLQEAMPELARLLAMHLPVQAYPAVAPIPAGGTAAGLPAPQPHPMPSPPRPSAAQQARNKFRQSSGLSDDDDDDE